MCGQQTASGERHLPKGNLKKERSRRVALRSVLAAAAVICMAATTTDSGSFLVLGSAPRLGLGLAALGRPGYINLGRDRDLAAADSRSPDAMRERAWAVLDAAWARGVRYFDCARSYGRSEEFLSGWLRERGLTRDAVVVGSKWGYRYTADWKVNTGGTPHEVKDHSLEHLESQLVETDALLGDNLWLYQIHSATLESGVLENQAVLDRLADLKKSKGWRVGLSLSGPKQADTLKKAIETGVFDAVQATWNLLEQRAGAALSQAKKSGMQVIIKEAMANGRLLEKPALVKAAEKLSAPADALALACVMVQDFEPMVLSGAVTVQQLDSNVEAVELAEKLKGEQKAVLDELMASLCMDSEAYWSERSALEWS
mmetsp:Transcript_49351/g.110657  ORF Transcript_49351/g.110657 Transcript_49351/m.110657 type:complete len:371 (-) Transcript_49351:61-1173(-)